MYIIKLKVIGSDKVELRELPKHFGQHDAFAVAAEVQKEYDRLYIRDGKASDYVRISIIAGHEVDSADGYGMRSERR